jgi:hypothetical protein
VSQPSTREVHHWSFQRGDVWLVDSRIVPHQVYFGRRMVSFYCECDSDSMQSPEKHVKYRLQAIHDDHAPIKSAAAA